MKKLILLFAIVASTILTSCLVIRTKTARTIDINGAGVIQKPIIADLEVKEAKVTGTTIQNIAKGVDVETVKENAVADVLKKANADVLVEPNYETEISGTKITVTVTGFPATYKNFRPITAEDVELLKVGVFQKAKVCETEVKQKKGSMSKKEK